MVTQGERYISADDKFSLDLGLCAHTCIHTHTFTHRGGNDIESQQAVQVILH